MNVLEYVTSKKTARLLAILNSRVNFPTGFKAWKV